MLKFIRIIEQTPLEKILGGWFTWLYYSKTKNIKELTRQADILCVCIGKPKYVDETWVKEGVILIDAGYNPSNLGDTDIEKIKNL